VAVLEIKINTFYSRRLKIMKFYTVKFSKIRILKFFFFS